MVNESWIPEITDERLAELVERIKPIVRWDNGDQYYIEPVDPRGVAFTWDPTPTKKAMGLMPIRDITTYHTFGYHGMFKPSIAEVLAMIPEDVIDEVVAFEIVELPETADDLNKNFEALIDGYHVAKTRLYKRH